MEGGAADDGTWEGLRRKYWHGRTEYYLPIATFVGDDGDDGEAEEGMELGTVEGQGDGDNQGSQSATADDTLVRLVLVGD